MHNYTYESKNKKESLEQYEWDNVWWENADVSGADRVLYIGDSISCETRRYANQLAGGDVFFDGLGTSKALDNPHFFSTIRLFAEQQRERKVILFNNGLHGWHLSDGEEYGKLYESMITFLMKEFPSVPIVLLLTTSVADGERDGRVVKRNQAVKAIAEKYGLETVDFYSIVNKNKNLLSEDGVHLIASGYTLLAEAVIKKVKEIIR